MRYALTGAAVLLPDGRLTAATVEVDGDRIGRVVEGRYRAAADRQVSTLDGGLLVPGFIDTHVHGRLGHNVMAGTREAVDIVGRGLLAHGVTSFVATTATVEYRRLMTSLAALADLAGPVRGGAELLGIHLEGPFLNPSRRGVHPESWLVTPSRDRIDALLDATAGTLRIVTMAPELTGAAQAIHRLVDSGVRVSIGHTDATFAQTVAAIDAGATRATHLFNAMPPIHHRRPGPIPALLADPRVRLEVIADGLHVAPELLGTLLAAPGLAGRLMLVSDGTDVAGLPDGPARRWEGTEVVLREGRAYTADGGGIAGGTLTVHDGVKNAVGAGVPTHIALAAASSVPAASLGLTDRGRIAPGCLADLLVLDDRLDIRTTILRGAAQEEQGNT